MFAELLGRPFAIAHRAGNDPERLRAALAAGAAIVEADLWLHRGRLEVRHTKTAGPLPVLWDRWSLHRGWGPRFQLVDLLRAAPGDVLLHLDLKGWQNRLGPAVRAAMQELAPGRPYLVSAQRWALLEPFHAEPTALVVHSIGSARRFARMERHARERPPMAIAIHRDLLSPERAERLRAATGLILAWPVNDTAEAARLAALGVRGFITDELAVVWAMHRGGAG